MKQKLFVCYIASLALSMISAAEAAPFYRETFRTCGIADPNFDDAAVSTGWKAFKADSAVGKVGTLKINLPGSPDRMLDYASFPYGAEEGSAFWSKAVPEPFTIFTEEVSFDISDLASVEYQQRLDGADASGLIHDGTSLAFLIDGTWFIAGTPTLQQSLGAWETVRVDPRSLAYGRAPAAGVGPTMPTCFCEPLPSTGTVRGVGLFMQKVNSKARFDNFTLHDSWAGEYPAGEQGSLEQCLASPVPTPVPTPTPTPTPGPAYPKCEENSSLPLGKITGQSIYKRRLFDAAKGKSPQAALERAILSLMLRDGLRIDQLEKLSVGDYDVTGAKPALRMAQSEPVALGAGSHRALEAYLSQAGFRGEVAHPLFSPMNPDGTSADEPLCGGQIRKIISRLIRKAEARGKLKITK